MKQNQKHVAFSMLIVKSVDETPMITMETNHDTYRQVDGNWVSSNPKVIQDLSQEELQKAYDDYVGDNFKTYKVQYEANVETYEKEGPPMLSKKTAHRLVDALSLEHLTELFGIEMIDPRAEDDFRDRVKDAGPEERTHLMHLDKHQVLEFTAQLKVKK